MKILHRVFYPLKAADNGAEASARPHLPKADTFTLRFGAAKVIPIGKRHHLHDDHRKVIHSFIEQGVTDRAKNTHLDWKRLMKQTGIQDKAVLLKILTELEAWSYLQNIGLVLPQYVLKVAKLDETPLSMLLPEVKASSSINNPPLQMLRDPVPQPFPLKAEWRETLQKALKGKVKNIERYLNLLEALLKRGVTFPNNGSPPTQVKGAEIATEIGITTSSLWTYLNPLITHGFLKKEGHGYWLGERLRPLLEVSKHPLPFPPMPEKPKPSLIQQAFPQPVTSTERKLDKLSKLDKAVRAVLQANSKINAETWHRISLPDLINALPVPLTLETDNILADVVTALEHLEHTGYLQTKFHPYTTPGRKPEVEVKYIIPSECPQL